MYNNNEIAYVYDNFIIDDEATLPRGLFSKSSSSAAANELTALRMIKYACEHYLHWDSAQMKAYLSYDILKILKLETLIQYINRKNSEREDGYGYIAEKIYPRAKKTFRDQTIETYLQSLKKGKRLPKAFFHGAEGKLRAKCCMQQCVNMLPTLHTVKELYDIFSSKEAMKVLRNFAISIVISGNQLYKDPLEYFHDSMPKDVKNGVYYQQHRFKEEFLKQHPGFSFSNIQQSFQKEDNV